jgi:2-amino-4-hydroxy-6-hydroxymethyldihydropteridine diphosphokinase
MCAETFSEPVTAYLGLGSNLDDPVEQVNRAFEELTQVPGCALIAVSALYRSKPMGPADQPDYINAVARLETRLGALELLQAMQVIERVHGRERKERWGARTLDVDLLLYGDEIIDLEELTVPHPGLHLRNFVLYPLHEVAPGIVIPGCGALDELIKHCSEEGLQRL